MSVSNLSNVLRVLKTKYPNMDNDIMYSILSDVFCACELPMPRDNAMLLKLAVASIAYYETIKNILTSVPITDDMETCLIETLEYGAKQRENTS